MGGMRGERLRCIVVFGCLTSAAFGSGATRELPDSIVPGASFTVTITIDPPPGTSVAAAEDTPPGGWSVSNISSGGTFDQQTGKVKWGLFFAPSIPPTLSYQVTASAPASPCFAGMISFDGAGSSITGDACTISVPTISTWSAVALSLMLLIGGTVIKRNRLTEEEGFEPP